MATKDRTALKDEFKNGNLATGERFTDLIDSVKLVQEPVTDPAASGTSLSFIDSISQDADGKITATKKTLDLANAHELNPFKGWYKTGDTLPTDGFDGAYLYFKDTSELTGQTTIYRWNGTTYADTGTVVDTSNVQTFETGQAVNGVAIDGTGLANPLPNALAKAVDVKGVKDVVEGGEQESVETMSISQVDKVYNTNNATVGQTWNYSSISSSGNACRSWGVTAGEKYKIYGKGNNGAVCQYVLLDNSKVVLYKKTGSVNSRETPTEVTIEQDGYLVVNFLEYDSETDKIEKITITENTGLVGDMNALKNRVAALENGGGISTTSTIVDDDTKVPTSKAVYDELHGTVSEEETTLSISLTDRYYNTSGATVGQTWNYSSVGYDGAACRSWAVHAGEKYKIYGYAGGGAVCQYVLLDNSKVVLYKKTGSVNSRETPTEVTIEQDGYLVVNLANYNSETDKIEQTITTVIGGIKNSINALDTRVTALESVEKSFTGKTFLVFGDSLSQLGSTVTGENSKRWSDYFGEITGATVVNVAIGGARLAQNRVSGSIITDPNATGYSNSMNIMSGLCVLNMVRAVCGLTFNESYTYMQLAQQFAQSATSASGAVGAVSRLAEVDITSIDGVIILAGGNDYQAGGDIEGTGVTSVQKAIELIVETLLTANPKLSIFWGTPLVCYATDNAGSGGVYDDTYWSDVYVAAGGKTGEQVADFVYEKVRLQKIPVVDMYHGMGWTKTNFNQWFYDHIHPRKGLKQIARKMAAFIIANRNFD